MNKLLEQVKNNIYTYNLIEDKDIIVIGLSGGPDSIFLIHALSALKPVIEKEKKITYRLHAAHINHKIREEAGYDENLAMEYATALGVPFHVLEIDVEAEAKKLKIGTEECGRHVRYDFFNKVKEELNATKIAVAHNAGDNAETIMLNFLRGAGLQGLSGMDYINSDIIRPILDIDKKDILDYLNENKIPYAIDKTNLENDYTRNKIRNDLLKKIENEFNPNIITALNRMAKINKQDNEIILNAVKTAYNNLGVKKDKDEIAIDTRKFNEYSEAMKFRLVRQIVMDLTGNVQNVEMIHVKDTCKLIEANITGKQYILGNKYKVVIAKKNTAVFMKNV
ncbi:MAG: tRNA lysidine(34) synthetase TilS [Clostridia bacterium]|nr:tRNA lysidine(34) synthetase TilS [Clostridia bacterium]